MGILYPLHHFGGALKGAEQRRSGEVERRIMHQGAGWSKNGRLKCHGPGGVNMIIDALVGDDLAGRIWPSN